MAVEQWDRAQGLGLGWMQSIAEIRQTHARLTSAVEIYHSQRAKQVSSGLTGKESPLST